MEDQDLLFGTEKKEYPIPRRVNSKFFFGFSSVDAIMLTATFFICNAILSPLIGDLVSTLNKMIYLNYGPTILLGALLREDTKTGESGMAILIDILRYNHRPKEYIYKGVNRKDAK